MTTYSSPGPWYRQFKSLLPDLSRVNKYQTLVQSPELTTKCTVRSLPCNITTPRLPYSQETKAKRKSKSHTLATWPDPWYLFVFRFDLVFQGRVSIFFVLVFQDQCYVYERVLYLHVYNTMCAWYPWRSEEDVNFLELDCGWLWATEWVPEIEFRSSANAVLLVTADLPLQVAIKFLKKKIFFWGLFTFSFYI